MSSTIQVVVTDIFINIKQPVLQYLPRTVGADIWLNETAPPSLFPTFLLMFSGSRTNKKYKQYFVLWHSPDHSKVFGVGSNSMRHKTSEKQLRKLFP